MTNRHHQPRHFSFSTLFQLVILILSLSGIVYSSEFYNISNAAEFIAFSKKVNNGESTFDGTTVFLTAEIDFSSKSDEFEPVGKEEKNKINFAGTFDGQGYTIKNLGVGSNKFRITALFGYSEGMAIKNLVFDESCSFSSHYAASSNDVFISSAIGYCNGASTRACIIENVVNKANIAYHGKNQKYVITGGIIAKCTGNCDIKNCGNFGLIGTSSEGTSKYIYSGGIIGEVDANGIHSIKKCLNYGPISNTMKGDNGISIGGIAGVICENTLIESCISFGPLDSEKDLSNKMYIGSIIGGLKEKTNNIISNCFWAESVGAYNASGEINTTVLTITSDSTWIELNETYFALLNKALGIDESGKWVIVDLNGGRIGGATYNMSFPQDHIPEPVKEGHSFEGWCNESDIDYPDPLEPSFPDDWDSTVIYALWTINNYTLTFDFDNGIEPEEKIFKFNENITYPENLKKEGHLFFGWDNNITKMPSRNLTIKAIWVNVTAPKSSVEIVFGTVDLTENKIEEIIKEYAPSADFEITNITRFDDETFVIVKFVDEIEAMNFVEIISASSEKGKHNIKKVSFIDEKPFSFSPYCAPSLLLCALVNSLGF